MSLIVAVKSCQAHRRHHQVIRDTWGKHIETVFFMGGGEEKESYDEVILDCPDDYLGLPFKTKVICEWAVSNLTVDYLFLCDTDSFLISERLLKSGFENYDYAGRFGGNISEPFFYEAIDREGRIERHDACFPWASGGFGYFLSRKAFSIIAKSEPTSWAEDLSVGSVMGPLAAVGEIKILDTTGQKFSYHFPAWKYHSGYELRFGWMEMMYKEHRC